MRNRVGGILHDVEAEIAEVIGKRRLETLREILMMDWSGSGDKE